MTGSSRSLSVVTAALVCIVLVACDTDSEAETTVTTVDVVTTMTSGPTTTSAPVTTSTVPEPTTTATTQPEASQRQFGFVVPFSVTIPTSWTRHEQSTQETLYIEAGINTIVFGVSDRETVDEWRDFLTNHEGLTATEPTEVELGGAPGFTTDVRLGPDATDAGCQTQQRCVNVLSGVTGWTIVDGSPNRIWVVDMDGRPVFIAAEASESSFDSFAADVADALTTLVWEAGS